jgi:metal-responsive CopG/Arc/MetJ family transcriptional regulator
MKAVHVLFDEALLRRLDADPEVKTDGRSAVLRRAAAEYLRTRRARRTSDAYRRAYGKSRSSLGDEYAGWPDEGTWAER